jgi:hypothetical protein
MNEAIKVNEAIETTVGKVRSGSIRTNKQTLQLFTGETCTLTVWVENTDSQPWSSSEEDRIYLSYHWKDEFGSIVEYDGIRTKINGAINENETTEQVINVNAPDVSGTYTLELTMVKEQGYWFEEVGFETTLIKSEVKPLTQITSQNSSTILVGIVKTYNYKYEYRATNSDPQMILTFNRVLDAGWYEFTATIKTKRIIELLEIFVIRDGEFSPNVISVPYNTKEVVKNCIKTRQKYRWD